MHIIKFYMATFKGTIMKLALPNVKNKEYINNYVAIYKLLSYFIPSVFVVIKSALGFSTISFLVLILLCKQLIPDIFYPKIQFHFLTFSIVYSNVAMVYCTSQLDNRTKNKVLYNAYRLQQVFGISEDAISPKGLDIADGSNLIAKDRNKYIWCTNGFLEPST